MSRVRHALRAIGESGRTVGCTRDARRAGAWHDVQAVEANPELRQWTFGNSDWGLNEENNNADRLEGRVRNEVQAGRLPTIPGGSRDCVWGWRDCQRRDLILGRSNQVSSREEVVIQNGRPNQRSQTAAVRCVDKGISAGQPALLERVFGCMNRGGWVFVLCVLRFVVGPFVATAIRVQYACARAQGIYGKNKPRGRGTSHTWHPLIYRANGVPLAD